MAPTGRQWAYGVGFVVVVALAIMIGIPAALLAASSSCACTSPADLIVLNDAHEDAAVSWEGPGLVGLPILGALRALGDLVVEANGHNPGPSDGSPAGGYPQDPLCD